MDEVETKLTSLPIYCAIVENKPPIVESLIRTDSVQELDTSSINNLFQLACSYAFDDIVTIFCRSFPRKVLSESFEILFDMLMKPTVVIGCRFSKNLLELIGFRFSSRKLHIIKLLSNQFFIDDLDNKKFVHYIQKKFYDSFYHGDVQLMNFLCSIFDKKYSPHQCYALFYQKHMSTICYGASELRYILPNNRIAFMLLLEMGMSQFGTMTPRDFRNIFEAFEHYPSISLNHILRVHILNSVLIQRSLEIKFSSDLSSYVLTYMGIPWGASLDSLQSVLNFFKINFFS